jgi:phytoene synthase
MPFQALGQLLSECAIPEPFLEDHLRGFALDEAGWHPRTEEDLALYCYYVAGAVGCIMAVIMGVSPEDSDTLETAAALGIAFQLSNIARDVREDFQAGRCYLPEAWLDEFGVDRATLFSPANETALKQMVERLIDRVAVYETTARQGVPRLPFRSRLAVLSALRIYGAIGRRVRKLGSLAWEQRVSIGKMRKLAFILPSFAEAVATARR